MVCKETVPIVVGGLGDNWSQVRYAASQACRGFYTIAKGDEELRSTYDPDLVPRMCLNRYYVAEGVKLYSQETWKLVFGEQGRETVAKYAREISAFYIAQSQADNHAVREASCHCISELCTKVAQHIDKEPFKPYVEPMLHALLDCFKDASWPVRDCACLACGHFVVTFPEECKAVYPELQQLWLDHLSDNIQSLRENTAASIAQVLKSETYAEEMFEKVRDHIKTNLLSAKEQKADSQKFKGLKNVTQFGVAGQEEVKSSEKHEHADDGHSDNTLFSCGSLAPKLKRGGGCMDHGFSRPKELWELSDGSIFMLRELSAFEKHHEFVIANLEGLSNLGYIDHFKHSHVLRENLFKSLIKIVENLGKKKFRGHIELFLDIAFRCSKSTENQLMAVAAQDCILVLSKTYGDTIFKAIVEGHDDRYLDELKRIKDVELKPKDFIYPTMQGQSPMASIMNGGAGGNQMSQDMKDIVCTKAPWAK